MYRISRPKRAGLSLLGLLAAITLIASSCGTASAAEPKDVIANYAAGVYTSYERSAKSAQKTQDAVNAFLANPTADTLAAAKSAWLKARDDYGRTEGFRFYDGPIDNEETGKEGEINAWPLDEQYIDYVQGSPNAGVINDLTKYPTIDMAVVTELNEKDGETNISTGWHAVEFLLWGQDLSETSAGNRPVTDYTTAANASRRGTYLKTVTDLLVTDLSELVDAWAPSGKNYRAEFVKLDEKEALRRIITGVGELSRGELAGERMSTALLNHSQEDEHSCFSDNTTNDLIANADAIRIVIEGNYGDGVDGPGIADLVAEKDKDLAKKLRDQVKASVASATKIPAPFDKSLKPGVSDDDPGRVAISDTIKLLQDQTDTIVSAASSLGVTINVS